MQSASGITLKLFDAGLKITPQRIAVLEAVLKLRNHPTAENVIDFIKTNHPNIATEMETGSARDYNEWANECSANSDSVSKKLFEALVEDEERHFNLTK